MAVRTAAFDAATYYIVRCSSCQGRQGNQKRYKEFPSPMPPQAIGGKQLQDLIPYLKNDLQQ